MTDKIAGVKFKDGCVVMTIEGHGLLLDQIKAVEDKTQAVQIDGLNKANSGLQSQIKAVEDEIQDCRDSWAPDQPPGDLGQFLIDLESVLE